MGAESSKEATLISWPNDLSEVLRANLSGKAIPPFLVRSIRRELHITVSKRGFPITRLSQYQKPRITSGDQSVQIQSPEATAVSLTGQALLEAPLLNTRTLPVILAVGTDNPVLLADPLYLGWHPQRVRGADYDAFLESFVQAVQRRFPQVLLQWEDFARQHARRVLERYRDRLCTFNDDIQGTGAVTLAGLLATLSLTSSELSEQRVVIVGAGSAATGIAEQLVAALVSEGVSVEAAR